MVIVARKESSGFDARFEPTEDTHIAVCVGCFDLGDAVRDWKGERFISKEVLIRWELGEDINVEGEYLGKHKCINKYYTANLTEKSNLYKDLVTWRGKDFSPEELKGFDLDNIIGTSCQLQIGIVNGKAKIISITKLMKGIETFQPDNLYRGDEKPAWIDKLIAKRQHDVAEFKKTQKTDKPSTETHDDEPLPF